MSDLHTQATELPAITFAPCHHFPDGEVPGFLCRKCHPELVLTPAQRSILDEAERRARQAAAAEDRRKRDLDRAKRELASLDARQPEFGSVAARIQDSLRKKIERLEAGGDA